MEQSKDRKTSETTQRIHVAQLTYKRFKKARRRNEQHRSSTGTTKHFYLGRRGCLVGVCPLPEVEFLIRIAWKGTIPKILHKMVTKCKYNLNHPKKIIKRKTKNPDCRSEQFFTIVINYNFKYKHEKYIIHVDDNCKTIVSIWLIILFINNRWFEETSICMR